MFNPSFDNSLNRLQFDTSYKQFQIQVIAHCDFSELIIPYSDLLIVTVAVELRFYDIYASEHETTNPDSQSNCN